MQVINIATNSEGKCHSFLLVLAGHMCLLRHLAQSGLTGRHVCCPNPTNSKLMSLHSELWNNNMCVSKYHPKRCNLFMISRSYRGSHSSRALRVSSGLCVVFLTQRSLLAIRWTCVSTPMPLTWPHPMSIHR